MPKYLTETGRTEIVELKRDSSPIQKVEGGEHHEYIHKLPTRIPNPCTLPNNPVYFRICE